MYMVEIFCFFVSDKKRKIWHAAARMNWPKPRLKRRGFNVRPEKKRSWRLGEKPCTVGIQNLTF